VSRPGFHDPVRHEGRVLVVGASEESPPPGVQRLEGVVDVSFADEADAVADALAGSDVVFAWRALADLLAPAWEHADALRWIQSASAGVDALLFPALVESPVIVTNARGVFDDAMAEYVLGLLLAFAKGLPGTLDRQRRHEWEHRETETLAGKQVLVVGVGSIGRAIARRCADQGMIVRGVASTPRPGDDLFRGIHGRDELVGAVRRADYVVNVLPGTAETRHAFDADVFGAMKRSARFVNVGRGSTVDESALIGALGERRIAGAALDVFEDEPLSPASALWEAPGAIVSPHMSGDVAGWREAVVELFVDNLRRYLSGQPLRNVVDKERGYVPT
jgi:phosphoglycerate dehydrogenase-like enzyme